MLTPFQPHPARVLGPARPSSAALQRSSVLAPANRSTQVLQTGRAPAQLSLFLRSGAIDVR